MGKIICLEVPSVDSKDWWLAATLKGVSTREDAQSLKTQRLFCLIDKVATALWRHVSRIGGRKMKEARPVRLPGVFRGGLGWGLVVPSKTRR